MSTHTMQALNERRHQIKISNRKPAEQIDGARRNAAPSAVLLARPVPAGQ